MKQKAISLAILLALFAASLPIAQASGSYNARPPRPPAGKDAAMDSDKYATGKKIFTDKAERKSHPGADGNSQKARLIVLQGKLPKSATEAQDLPALAGKLSARELEALEYYLEKRFKVK